MTHLKLKVHRLLFPLIALYDTTVAGSPGWTLLALSSWPGAALLTALLLILAQGGILAAALGAICWQAKRL